jgi:hypothetical protein
MPGPMAQRHARHVQDNGVPPARRGHGRRLPYTLLLSSGNAGGAGPQRTSELRRWFGAGPCADTRTAVGCKLEAARHLGWLAESCPGAVPRKFVGGRMPGRMQRPHWAPGFEQQRPSSGGWSPRPRNADELRGQRSHMSYVTKSIVMDKAAGQAGRFRTTRISPGVAGDSGTPRRCPQSSPLGAGAALCRQPRALAAGARAHGLAPWTRSGSGWRWPPSWGRR